MYFSNHILYSCHLAKGKGLFIFHFFNRNLDTYLSLIRGIDLKGKKFSLKKDWVTRTSNVFFIMLVMLL
jgi:hypothetical protein